MGALKRKEQRLMDERKEEPNWTELLEKEYRDLYGPLIDAQRKDGHSDKETYLLLESFG